MMSDDLDRAAIMAAHQPDSRFVVTDWCSTCPNAEWPCEPYRLAAALAAAEASWVQEIETRRGVESDLATSTAALAAAQERERLVHVMAEQWESDDDTDALLRACAALASEGSADKPKPDLGMADDHDGHQTAKVETTFLRECLDCGGYFIPDEYR